MLSADKGNSVEVYNEGSVLSCSEELVRREISEKPVNIQKKL